MFRLFALLLPVLIPSWRFFSSVGPSPRVHWSLDTVGCRETWQEFRPRPHRVSMGQILLRLLWNPVWNENLFLTSCAERIQDEPTERSIQQIRHRIWAELRCSGVMPRTSDAVRFRLVFVHHDGSDLNAEVVFQSDRGA